MSNPKEGKGLPVAGKLTAAKGRLHGLADRVPVRLPYAKSATLLRNAKGPGLLRSLLF